ETSSASVRPAASASGTRSAPSGAAAARMRSTASRTPIQSARRPPRCSATCQRLRSLSLLRRVDVEEQRARVAEPATLLDRAALNRDVVVEPDDVQVSALELRFDRGDA